ncbi:MAG: DUF3422 domain-containing protein [Burkholderiales bacterium]|nr:DUF3422 domain-containing protein [Burkholderiales bacterium]
MIDHPQRASLHNEIHARPPEPMTAPLVISHVVMLTDADERAASREHLSALLRDHHLPALDAQVSHSRHTLTMAGGVRLRWERHTEFVSWTFMRSLPDDALPDAQVTAHAALPAMWMEALPGRRLVAMHLWATPKAATPVAASGDTAALPDSLVRGLLLDETLVGSAVGDGGTEVYTDFAMHPDGFSRVLLCVGNTSARGLGRLIQRLLEIETYRMAALMGFPAALQVSGELTHAERDLSELAAAIRAAHRHDEPQLLDRLTHLAGQIESQYAALHSRFSASSAYFALVDKRISELGETRIAGLQTIREFMDRRLSPARNTCEWAVRRQDGLSQRVSRMSNLLRTRVEITQQQNSEALLKAMNDRQDLQLKLQSTVEGLSVAAITYYIVGLISYVAKGAQTLGWPFSPESTAAVAIPLVGFAVWWSIRRLHRRLRLH